MWIIPNTLQFSQFAPDRLDLSEASTEFEIFEQSLMWRSKPSQSTTWLKRWKKVRWIQHLFGQILKPSIYNHFATKYAESLVDIPVKENQLQGEENSKKTLDGFGRLYDSYSRQISLFSDFSKTQQGTYLELSDTFSQTYEAWATMLRQEYSVRLSAALHKSGNVFLSLQLPTETDWGTCWPTPTASEGWYQQSPNTKKKRLQLTSAVKYWPTPKASDYNKGASEGDLNRNSPHLAAMVVVWPTPTACEAEKATADSHQTSLTKLALSGLLHPASLNIDGNTPGQFLNPAWVAQLMGTTLEEILFDCSETQ